MGIHKLVIEDTKLGFSLLHDPILRSPRLGMITEGVALDLELKRLGIQANQCEVWSIGDVDFRHAVLNAPTEMGLGLPYAAANKAIHDEDERPITICFRSIEYNPVKDQPSFSECDYPTSARCGKIISTRVNDLTEDVRRQRDSVDVRLIELDHKYSLIYDSYVKLVKDNRVLRDDCEREIRLVREQTNLGQLKTEFRKGTMRLQVDRINDLEKQADNNLRTNVFILGVMCFGIYRMIR